MGNKNSGRKIINFKFNIGDKIKDNKRDLSIIDKKIDKETVKYGSGYRTRSLKLYKYHCNTCTYESWIKESNLLYNKNGCSCCNGKTVVKGINDIATTAPHVVKYLFDKTDAFKYTKSSGRQVICKCPDCNYQKKMIIGHLVNRGFSCICSDSVSYPNKFAYAFLSQLPIYNVSYEYSPEWAKPYRYDSYFEYKNKKYILEMDGGLGHGNLTYANQKDTFGLKVDLIKDKIAKQKNIIVIRIDCKISDKNYIASNIINSKLNSLFNLKKIDWEHCDRYATSNLVKTICDYWKLNYKNTTTTKVGELFGLSQSTVRGYLKRGTKLNWCIYDSYEEKLKSWNCDKNSKKRVEIFKNGKSLGIFPSVKELSHVSEQLFGILLIQSGIAQVCRNEKVSYKGFTFKYIEQSQSESQQDSLLLCSNE